MEEELSLDNILEVTDINELFLEEEDQEETPVEDKSDQNTKKETNTETIEVDPSTLFEEEEPESVNSNDEDNQETGKKPTSEKDKASSSNFYSSIAKALKEDGVFSELEDSSLEEIKEAEDFAYLIEKQIQAKLDAKQQRINQALNAGVEDSNIKKYEDTLAYLDSLTDSVLNDESEKGETLRKQLIYQDFINRGYSKERAQREVTKSLNAGTDIDDARESLEGNKEYFQSEYDELIKEYQDAKAEEYNQRKEQAEKLKKSIMSDEKVFGDIEVNTKTRQKVMDNISKPIYKDPKTGELFSALQKYERDNKIDFIKNVGLLYTLTNGFKDLNGLVKSKVNKEVKKGLRELESTLNNTSRGSDGALKYISNVSEDSESFIGKEWNIDV